MEESSGSNAARHLSRQLLPLGAITTESSAGTILHYPPIGHWVIMPTPDKNIGYALAWLILGIGVSGAIIIASITFSMDLHGPRGLWIPALLCIPTILQCAAAYHLKRIIGAFRRRDPFHPTDDASR